MNEELKELHEAKYSLNRQITVVQEIISIHYTNIKREEVRLISLRHELKEIEERIKYLEEDKDKGED